MGVDRADAARTRVAVLGGGPGALTAAFELTATPELRDRYEVTVHQLGWRLGGKGASGRNAEHAQRIEEHGLHIWFGFYDNSFSLIRRCYEELGRPAGAPLASWTDAFKPRNDCVQFERFRGEWVAHSFELPANPLTPGDHVEVDFWEPVHRTFAFLEREWGGVRGAHADAVARAPAPRAHHGRLQELATWLRTEVVQAEHVTAEHLLRAGRELAKHLEEAGHPGLEDRALRLAAHLLDALRDWLWRHVVSERIEDTELRMFFMWVDLAATILTGIAEDDLGAKGFGAINDEELREWLRRHGASELTLEASPLVRAVYDAAFCFVDGDIDKPDVAAGKAVQDLIRSIFLYKGALMYKMQAGMGDTVFSPLYEVLKRRGVRFEFFHCVTRLGTDGHEVDEIDVVEQATVAGGGEYRPLVEVNGLPCWPSAPDLSQLEDADRLAGADFEGGANPLGREPTTLRRGRDFDEVVLGIPVGALPPICGELAQANARFAEMLSHARTVMTQAFQLWLTVDVQTLGWNHRPGTLASCYVEPVDTYCDMTHLLPREQWGPEVRNIAYFCGVLPEGFASQDEADAHVARALREYLRTDLPTLWPEFQEGMIAATYTRANWTGSERYALTPAGEVRYRLWPDESGFRNLALAGDWTRNGIDGGSVEAAVTSGMLASQALSGHPAVVRGTSSWLESDRGDADG